MERTRTQFDIKTTKTTAIFKLHRTFQFICPSLDLGLDSSLFVKGT